MHLDFRPSVTMLEPRTHRGRYGSPEQELSLGERDLRRHLSETSSFPSSDSDTEMLRQSSARWIMGRRPHVCVIGAGAAGLRCTEILLDRGIEVTLIEARDRVGGRVSLSMAVCVWTATHLWSTGPPGQAKRILYRYVRYYLITLRTHLT